MRSYAQYCPIAKGSEILGDRWTLLIVREMLGGASGFNELQRGLPGISRSVLTDRLRSLERAEIVERRTGPKGRTLEYRLTLAGRDLEPVVQAIGEWGVTWSFTDPRPEELDPDLLIVWMARHVDREQLPSDRTVVQFDFRNPAKRYWMVLEPSDVSVCLQHPGFDVDLEVRVDTATLYRVYLGRAELGAAMREHKLTLSGPKVLQRAFGRWFAWSAFAPASRRADQRRRAASRLARPEGAGRPAAAGVSSLERLSKGSAVRKWPTVTPAGYEQFTTPVPRFGFSALRLSSSAWIRTRDLTIMSPPLEE